MALSWHPKAKVVKSAYTSFISDTVRYWPGLLEAWLVLTSVKYHGNLYILSPLNQWLALTRLRATSPWWRGCSLVLQCFVENCREGEILCCCGESVLTRMSLDVSVECYFLSIMKHSPPTILLTNELLIIECCLLSPLCCCLQLLFVALLSPFSLVWPKLLECPVSMCLTPP